MQSSTLASRVCFAALLLVTWCGVAITHPAEAATCLAKVVTGAGGATTKQRVLAPDSEVTAYERYGLVVEQCEWSLEKARQNVERLCLANASRPENVHQEFQRTRGYSLNQLCASGRAAVAEMER